MVAIIDDTRIKKLSVNINVICIIDGIINFEKSNLLEGNIEFLSTEKSMKIDKNYKFFEIPDTDFHYDIKNGNINMVLFKEYTKQLPKGLVIIPIITDANKLKHGIQANVIKGPK